MGNLKIVLISYISDFSGLSLEDVDSVSEADRDTLAPLPPPQWNNQYPYSSSNYLPQNLNYIPPYSYASTDSQSFVGSFVDGADSRLGGNFAGPGSIVAGNNSTGSVHSGSGGKCRVVVSCLSLSHETGPGYQKTAHLRFPNSSV